MYTSNLHVRALTDFCFELNRSAEKVLCRFSLLSCQLFRSGFNPCLINGQGPDLREDQLYCHSDIQGGKMSFFCQNLGICSLEFIGAGINLFLFCCSCSTAMLCAAIMTEHWEHVVWEHAALAALANASNTALQWLLDEKVAKVCFLFI